MKHPILVLILAAFATFAFQAQAGTIPHSSGTIPGSNPVGSGLLLAASSEQQQEQDESTGEEEEEPECE